jgi:hypothetical protein
VRYQAPLPAQSAIHCGSAFASVPLRPTSEACEQESLVRDLVPEMGGITFDFEKSADSEKQFRFRFPFDNELNVTRGLSFVPRGKRKIEAFCPPLLPFCFCAGDRLFVAFEGAPRARYSEAVHSNPRRFCSYLNQLAPVEEGRKSPADDYFRSLMQSRALGVFLRGDFYISLVDISNDRLHKPRYSTTHVFLDRQAQTFLAARTAPLICIEILESTDYTSSSYESTRRMKCGLVVSILRDYETIISCFYQNRPFSCKQRTKVYTTGCTVARATQ